MFRLRYQDRRSRSLLPIRSRFSSQAASANALALAYNRADFRQLDICPDFVPNWLVDERNRAELEGRD